MEKLQNKLNECRGEVSSEAAAEILKYVQTAEQTAVWKML